MDSFDWMLVAVLGLIVGGAGYGAYHTGRMLERRAYTKAFMAEVETAYWAGFDDGRKPVSHGR